MGVCVCVCVCEFTHTYTQIIYIYILFFISFYIRYFSFFCEANDILFVDYKASEYEEFISAIQENMFHRVGYAINPAAVVTSTFLFILLVRECVNIWTWLKKQYIPSIRFQ